MARLVTGDPAEKRRLVEVVGSNVVSETFFGMATGYSVEDALHVSNIRTITFAPRFIRWCSLTLKVRWGVRVTTSLALELKRP